MSMTLKQHITYFLKAHMKEERGRSRITASFFQSTACEYVDVRNRPPLRASIRKTCAAT